MSTTSVALDEAYRTCAREVRRSAANFYYAFRLLPRAKRRALHAVYYFCRGADDIADSAGTAESRRLALENYRRALRLTLAGEAPDAGWLTLADAVERFGIDGALLEHVIDGCAADCSPLEIITEGDLARYCYGVAGSVGLISARIFGYSDPAVPQLALKLGEAMQLTNILRDLREDLENDRCYLPQRDLELHGLTRADLLAGGSGPRASAYRELMRREVSVARRNFAAGRGLVPLVERDARGCPAALAALYQAVLREIERRDFDVQRERISLSPAHKVGLAAGAWLAATIGP